MNSSLKSNCKQFTFQSYHISSFNNPSKLNHHAEYKLRMTSCYLDESMRCKRCFMKVRACLCQSVSNIFNHCPHISSQILIYTHFKEFGKSSNSGKLMNIGLNDNVETLLYGIKSDENTLLQRLSSSPSVILYPSVDSTPIEEYQDWYKHHTGNILLCVIDSTWSLSKAMVRLLPKHIPRVNINNLVTSPSLYLSRHQSKNTQKVSTVEATALALAALGEDKRVIDVFNNALMHSVDCSLVQAGKAAVYNSALRG